MKLIYVLTLTPVCLLIEAVGGAMPPTEDEGRGNSGHNPWEEFHDEEDSAFVGTGHRRAGLCLRGFGAGRRYRRLPDHQDRFQSVLREDEGRRPEESRRA